MNELDELLKDLENEKTEEVPKNIPDTVSLPEAETHPVVSDVEAKPRKRKRKIRFEAVEEKAEKDERGKAKKKYRQSRRRARRSSGIDWFFG